MPATIEANLPKEIDESLSDDDLPLLVTNGRNVYLASINAGVVPGNIYSMIYLHDINGSCGDSSLGKISYVSRLDNYRHWKGSVNIENNP